MANGFVDGFCLRLANQFSQGQIRTIREQLDIYSMGFTITQIENGTVSGDYELPKELAVFLEVKRQDGRMNNRSYDQYYSCLTKLLYDLRLPLRSITVNHLRMHIAKISMNKRTGKPLSNTTLDQRKSIIRSFFKWLYEEEYIESDPSTRIRPVRAAYKPREAYADTQVEAIRDSCKNDRDRAIVDLLAASGIRVEECCRLDRSDIDLEKREVKVFGKGHKYRTSFIDARAVVSIEKYLKSRDDNEDPLFVSLKQPHKRLGTWAIRKILERLEPASGVDNIIPHRFRHTTATTAISNGMPVESVQAMLGHSIINTTMRYAHVSYDKVKRDHDTYMRQ